MDWKQGIVIWIQCTPQGDPVFMTASPDKLYSRMLAKTMLYSDEMDLDWFDIVKRDAIVEKRFLVREID